MAVRCFAKDYESDEISCLLLHPDHVKTDMGGPEGSYFILKLCLLSASQTDCQQLKRS